MITNRFSDDLAEAGVSIGFTTYIMILWFTAQFVLYVIAFAYWFILKPNIAVFVGISTIEHIILGVLSVYERKRYNRRRWSIQAMTNLGHWWLLLTSASIFAYALSVSTSMSILSYIIMMSQCVSISVYSAIQGEILQKKIRPLLHRKSINLHGTRGAKNGPHITTR